MKYVAILALLVCSLSVPARANTMVLKTASSTLTCVQTKSHKGVQEFRCTMRSLQDATASPESFAYRGPYPGAMRFVDFACGQGCQIYTAGTDVSVSSSNVISLPTTLTQAYTFSGSAVTYTGQISQQYSTQTTCPGSGAPIANAAAPLCLGPTTGAAALVIGKASGTWGGTTTSNSGALRFIRNNGAADSSCDITYLSGGSMSVGCTFSTNSNNFSAGSGTATLGKLNQNATGDFAGHCTMSASTTCTVTLVAAYTTPNCTATVNSATPLYAGVTVSGATVTVTANASNSSTWFVHCVGDPS